VYGFQHAPDVHRGIFDVLLHRARARVRGLAEIEREGDRLRLKGKQPFLVPDPRSVQPLEEFMLRLVARSGGASAKEAAEALNVPLRTVHRALQRLVSEGACQRARAGRTVVYRIEDTTFQEPTRA
jgi:Fic family protein